MSCPGPEDFPNDFPAGQVQLRTGDFLICLSWTIVGKIRFQVKSALSLVWFRISFVF